MNANRLIGFNLMINGALAIGCGPVVDDTGIDEQSSETSDAAEDSTEATSNPIDTPTSDPVDSSTSTGSSDDGDPTDTPDPNTCGNGMIDPGEECEPSADPGSPECRDCRLPSGTALWSTSFDGGSGSEGSEDQGVGITVGPDGSVHVVGSVRGSAGSDLWYGVLEPTGELRTTATYDLGGDEYGHGIVVDEAGEVLLAAHAEGIVDVVSPTPQSGALASIGSAPHDSTFAVVVAPRRGGAEGGGFHVVRVVGQSAAGSVVAVDVADDGVVSNVVDDMPIGGMVLGASAMVGGGLVLVGTAAPDSVLLHALDADGETQWQVSESLGFDAPAFLVAVDVGPRGSIVASGFASLRDGSAAPFIGRWSAEGRLDRIDVIDAGDGELIGWDLALGPDEVILAGSARAEGSSYDAAVAAFGADSRLLWGSTHDGAANLSDRAYGIARGVDTSDVFVVGVDMVPGEGENIWVARVRA